MEEEIIKTDEIGEIPKSELKHNPFLQIVADYIKGCKIYEDQDEYEREELRNKLKKLNELLETGIFEDSTIANAYQKVLESYQRLLWIYTKNVSLANQEIARMKKIFEKLNKNKKEK